MQQSFITTSSAMDVHRLAGMSSLSTNTNSGGRFYDRKRIRRGPSYQESQLLITDKDYIRAPLVGQIFSFSVVCFFIACLYYWMMYSLLRNHHHYVAHSAISSLTVFLIFFIMGAVVLPVLRQKQDIHVILDESNISFGAPDSKVRNCIDYARVATFCLLSPHRPEYSEIGKIFGRNTRNIVSFIAATSRLSMQKKLRQLGIDARYFPLVKDRRTGAFKESENDAHLLLSASTIVQKYSTHTPWHMKILRALRFLPKPVLCIVSGDSNMENIATSFPLTAQMAVQNGFDVEVVYWKSSIGVRAWNNVMSSNMTFRPLDDIGPDMFMEGNWYLLPDKP